MLTALLAQIPAKPLSADAVLSPYIYVFYASFLVTLFFTPVMRIVANFYGVVDQPDQIRKVHAVPIAYLGGVAMFLGWLCGVAVSQYLVLHRIQPGWPTQQPIVKFSIVLGALVIILLGLWDDIRGISPFVKILGQVLAALFLLWDGVGIEVLGPLLSPVAARLGFPPLPPWVIIGLSSAFVVVVVVGCCNASNLMDGLDGLCGGVTAIIALGFLFVAVHLAMIGGGVRANSDALRVILALALLGAVLGFVPFNFNPASIFMGDTGSMLLGFSCATMIVMMGEERSRWLLAAMVMFALPVLDTCLAFARRWVNGRPLFSADKQHFHHQLVARGYSVKGTVLISYGLALLFAALGVCIVFVRTRYAVAMYMLIFGYVVVAAYKMGMVHERPAGGKPLGLDSHSSESHPTIEPGTVFEIKDKPVTGPGRGSDDDDATDERAA